MGAGSLSAKLAKMTLGLVPPTTVAPVLQGKLRGKKWVTGSSRHVCWLGTYEATKRALFERTVHPGDIVFDIGANVGYYALLASILVGEQGQVYAFEPLPGNLEFLKLHLKLNHIQNVHVIEAAVAETSGTASFDPGVHPSMGKISHEGGLTVRLVCLDELIAQHTIPVPQCLKIDVEGAELRVLKGAEQLVKHHPKIFLATHGNDMFDECLKLLQHNGYRLHILEQDRDLERAEIFAE